MHIATAISMQMQAKNTNSFLNMPNIFYDTHLSIKKKKHDAYRNPNNLRDKDDQSRAQRWVDNEKNIFFQKLL